eukprot:CAMPEP_0184872252 /NCGR_PEP_ID=MMETSP0580-20130426/41178_1 /TAXON_ID=1118495 /ORGANISM="Dactyliosolen fragilissimus" /LENGTH=480 /DNA_ID=CAMNT_0027375015 /DNA_START=402 /DNA_END=1841 /DNA_ORIENTATION=+
MSDRFQRQPIASTKSDSSSSLKESGGVPSGFVLKLYQMVNGAPDDVISWLPSGDAFRISDLNRLENETLPTFFRHKRFQSLVRQLNFYNFRKVNRERTFWVYRHALFHRDRPGELHLLRRRTCPGVDGRKHRPEIDMSGLGTRESSPSKRPSLGFQSQQSDLTSDESVGSANDSKKRNMSTHEFLGKKLRRSDGNKNAHVKSVQRTHTDSDTSSANPSTHFNVNTKSSGKKDLDDHVETLNNNVHPSHPSFMKARILPLSFSQTKKETSSSTETTLPYQEKHDSVVKMGEDKALESLSIASNLQETHKFSTPPLTSPSIAEADDAKSDKKSRSERMEHCLLVNKVARQLDAHAKRAAAAAATGVRRGGRRRGGTVTPPRHFPMDTMKHHALTYDDEIANSDMWEDGDYHHEFKKGAHGAVVTDIDDSEDDGKAKQKDSTDPHKAFASSMHCTKHQDNVSEQPPIDNALMVSDVVKKLQDW